MFTISGVPHLVSLEENEKVLTGERVQFIQDHGVGPDSYLWDEDSLGFNLMELYPMCSLKLMSEIIGSNILYHIGKLNIINYLLIGRTSHFLLDLSTMVDHVSDARPKLRQYIIFQNSNVE